jgi:hypothetical protein
LVLLLSPPRQTFPHIQHQPYSFFIFNWENRSHNPMFLHSLYKHHYAPCYPHSSFVCTVAKEAGLSIKSNILSHSDCLLLWVIT